MKTLFSDEEKLRSHGNDCIFSFNKQRMIKYSFHDVKISIKRIKMVLKQKSVNTNL